MPMSHLGFGRHPNAHWDHSLHYPTSTGPDNDMGGKRDTKDHIDTPMCDCTMLLDNEVVLERGKFVDQKMIVPQARG